MSKQTLGARVPADVGSAAAAIKQPVVLPSVQFTRAEFTANELRALQQVCRDADNENAVRYLAAAIKRGDGRQ